MPSPTVTVTIVDGQTFQPMTSAKLFVGPTVYLPLDGNTGKFTVIRGTLTSAIITVQASGYKDWNQATDGLDTIGDFTIPLEPLAAAKQAVTLTVEPSQPQDNGVPPTVGAIWSGNARVFRLLPAVPGASLVGKQKSPRARGATGAAVSAEAMGPRHCPEIEIKDRGWRELSPTAHR